jgi:hypothetical protein
VEGSARPAPPRHPRNHRDLGRAAICASKVDLRMHHLKKPVPPPPPPCFRFETAPWARRTHRCSRGASRTSGCCRQSRSHRTLRSNFSSRPTSPTTLRSMAKARSLGSAPSRRISDCARRGRQVRQHHDDVSSCSPLARARRSSSAPPPPSDADGRRAQRTGRRGLGNGGCACMQRDKARMVVKMVREMLAKKDGTKNGCQF